MSFAESVRFANQKAVNALISADPYWVDVKKAIDFLPGMTAKTVLHSGPPISFTEMTDLHRHAMINAVLFERLAKTEAEAEAMILSGEIKIDSAFNYPTVGSGVGVISASVPLLICLDKTSGTLAGAFPHEGRFGGGFCCWGVYSEEIAENLRMIGAELLGPIARILRECGGFPLKEIISESLTMGDENHSSQSASDALFIRKFIPYALQCVNSSDLLSYLSSAHRFFHNFCQSASRASILSAVGVQNSSMVVAAGGNGVEFGIQVAGLPGRWFTAPSPMIRGRYMTEGAREEDQLPWIGDSSIVECAGLGGLLSGASPTVCSYRGQSLADGIAITESMRKICIGENPAYRIPNLAFVPSPVGIDVLKVIESGILPVINGGMIDRNGGWMGAGYARIPMACFEKAAKALRESFEE